MMDRINICDMLLKRNEIEPFLKRMISGDEKWITYDNPTRKRSWIEKGEKAQAIAKSGLTRKKVMLCVCGGTGRESFTMSLSSNQTINSELYCEQLQRLQQAIERKRPELINWRAVVFHHDNARPHTSLMTRQKLRKLGWKVLMHPLYSPAITPSDYHCLGLCRTLLME